MDMTGEASNPFIIALERAEKYAASLHDEIERLRAKLAMIHDIAQNTVEPCWQALDNIRATAAGGLNRTGTEQPQEGK